ncbi:MAG: GntR family transcriptional regulator [Deltaproteobacteria bacterium]|nr:MAG: GntR family transcriptional regulator [Deltaproteobacteria bacterium]
MINVTPAKKEPSEDKAYRLILEAIRNTYQPGEFLLEKNIVTSLKMSRTPVAMALNRLVTEGILNKVPKKGCYIPNLNRDDATAAFQARKLLEGAAAKDAAKFSSSKELKDLSKFLDKGEKAIEDKNYRLFAETDEKFHHRLVKLSKNEYIYRTWRLVYFRTNIYSRFFDNLYYNTETIVSGKILKMKSPQQHRTILQALIDKDPIKCKSRVVEHIEHALQMIFNK